MRSVPGAPPSSSSAASSRQSLVQSDTLDRGSSSHDHRYAVHHPQSSHVVHPSSMAGVSNGPIIRHNPAAAAATMSAASASSVSPRAHSPASSSVATYATSTRGPTMNPANSSSPISSSTYSSKNNSRTSLANNSVAGGVNTAYTGPETDIDTLTRGPHKKTDDGYHSNRSTGSYHNPAAGGGDHTNPHFIDGVCSKDVIV